MHKNPSINCLSCAEKFLGCDPKIVAFVKKVQQAFQDCHVAVGFRDQADQHTARVQGRSTFDWPDSPHNFMLYTHPYSKACDLFQLGVDGQAHFITDYYKHIWDWYLANSKSFGQDKYSWGGSYLHLKDYDHFQCEDL